MGEKRWSMLRNVFHNCPTLCRRDVVIAEVLKSMMHILLCLHIPWKGNTCLVLVLAMDLTGTDWCPGSNREAV